MSKNVPFETLRRQAEIKLQEALGMDASYEQITLTRKYSLPVVEGKLTAGKAVEEIRNASE